MTPRSTVERLLDVASSYPDDIAVLGQPTPLRYAELVGVAGGYAEALVDAGAQSGHRIGLLSDHGAATIGGILGTLGAGCAYVPLDPSYPAERLALILDHAAVTMLLTTRAHEWLAREILGGRDCPVVFGDELAPAELHAGRGAGPDDQAYVLYTSGSTGTPKGVPQTHRNLLHCADNQIETLQITRADRLSLLASFSFDAAIPDLYPALLSGAAVVPVDVRRHGLAHAAVELARHGVTIYHSTPTVYRYLLDALGPTGRLPTVRVVLLGGEQSLLGDVARGVGRFAEGCVFVNGYGMTEATFAAQCQLPAGHCATDPSTGANSARPLPIGTALPGYEVVLLDPAAQPADDTGEIAIRSNHLTPGYWRDPERTAERFSTDPDGTRVYRTGDLGRRLRDGRLVCLGRLDRQVKIRGFRVELAEVEANLSALPGVAAALAVARGEDLLGYVQPAPDAPELDPAGLRAALAAALPDHLVPRTVVVVQSLPLTPSGKIDIRGLPAPPQEPAQPPADRPRTPTEQAVHDAWCAVLGVSQLRPTDNFADVGGHSLLLGLIQQRLVDTFDAPIPLVRLLEHPTIRAQATYLDGELGAAAPHSATWPQPSVATVVTGDDNTGEDIAVVGLAGRFPAAPDIRSFWQQLTAGVDCIHDFTDDELRELGIGPGLLADPRHVKAGGWVADVTDFDADFFSFGTDEAARTDPQQRLFLETAWEALEDAGHDPTRADGSVGLFASTSPNRYFLFHLFDNPVVAGKPDRDDWEARLLGGQQPDHLPGQVAYRLGLNGPALAVQSACSSSLVAVCQAAQSLADYRCDVALAGGVSVAWPRFRYVPGGLVSPDGRCRAFDAAAQGSGFSSGAGVVALKRLADAQADHDHVYATLPGWAVTNDGSHRAGFGVPGLSGQMAAIAEALSTADRSAADLRLVETHGSGTLLGDAIELSALTQVYRAAGATAPDSCALGAVKTNIGHLDAAAGVAGLIKAVLAVQHAQIPPNLHYRRPNPEADLVSGPFYVPTKALDWPAVDRRVAGVSAFGLGGTNAHVIVEQAPPSRAPAHSGSQLAPGSWLLPISARTSEALTALLTRLRDHLAARLGDPQLSLADVAYTLAVGRRPFPYRAALACPNLAEAVAGLSGLLATGERVGGSPEDLVDLGRHWVDGGEVDWGRLHGGGAARRVPLPTYPFQRRRCWIDPPSRDGVEEGQW